MRKLTFCTSTVALTLITLTGCSGDAGDSDSTSAGAEQYTGTLGNMGAVNANGDAPGQTTNTANSDNDNDNDNAAPEEDSNLSENDSDSAANATLEADINGSNGDGMVNTASSRPNRGTNLGDGDTEPDADNGAGNGADNEDGGNDQEEGNGDASQDPIMDDQTDPEPDTDDTQPEPLDVQFPELYQTIFLSSCGNNNCHGANAPRAPFGADDEQFAYEVISANAESILERLQGINGGIMPRGCGNGVGNGRCLTQAQFDAVQDWVDAGTPR